MDKHVLILRFSALGDVAMTLPVIYSVAKANPDVTFTVATRPFFARIFINPPANVSVTGIDPKDYRGVTGTVRLLHRLASLRPTAVADIHNMLRTWIIDNFFRARGVKVVMVDKMRQSRKDVLRSGARQIDFIQRYCKVFRQLGLNFELTFRSLIPEGAVLPEKVEHPAVGIAPFARYHTKTYPPEMMRRVVEILCHKGVNVYLFGARGDEAATLGSWAAEIDGCVSVAGKYPIEDELVLMSRMDLMVSMDSANQHLASLAGTRILTVWGATTPACGFSPYGDSRDLISVRPCQPCSVAGTASCPKGNLECLRTISPETLAEKIISMINEKNND